MDAASALRGARLLAAAAGLGAAACGAAPAGQGQEAAKPGGAASDRPSASGLGDGERVTAGDPPAVHARIAAALSKAGYPCTAANERVACKGDLQHGAGFYVIYREYPARLLFGSPWQLKGSCEDALPAVNAFNWEYDELHASCDEHGTVVVSGVYFVPEGGIGMRDVLGFARWWSLAEVRALSTSKLGPLLR